MSWLGDVWQRLATGPAPQATQVRIADDHVIGGAPARVLEADRDYLTVQINKFHLGYGRRLWQEYTPTLWTNVELAYAGQRRSIPVVIGTSGLGQNGTPVPNGMVYRGIRVLGPVPYRGGSVSLSVILSRVSTDNYLNSVLDVVESIASAVGQSGTLAPYLTVTRAVETGLASMLRLGSQPVIGMQDTLTPDAPDAGEFRTGWYVLMDVAPAGQFWVVDHELRVGPDPGTAVAPRDCTYVLYSVSALPRESGRNDAASLPDLAAQRALIERLAVRPDADSLSAAEILLSELAVAMRTHPDLVRPQANVLLNEWRDEMYAAHEEATTYPARAGDQDDELQSITSLVLSVAGRR